MYKICTNIRNLLITVIVLLYAKFEFKLNIYRRDRKEETRKKDEEKTKETKCSWRTDRELLTILRAVIGPRRSQQKSNNRG